MPYSDLTLKNATQVAYKDFQEPFDQLVAAGKKPPFSIDELCRQMGTTVEDLFPDLDGQKIGDWKIVDYYDTNHRDPTTDTGFYGCVIDIGDGDAIVAFRGSEGATDLSNLQHDWIEADLGLLNATLTIQQGEVYKFLKQISESDYINDYDSLGMTGHSLGGNLAMHGAVVSAMPEIGLSDKLERCVSFDGPGYSDEYLEENIQFIEKVKGKITHYKWSPVGGLLFEFPGVPRIPLKFTEKDDFLYNLITRHDTRSIEFDGENAIIGEETPWDTLTSKFSQGIDHMPKIVGDTLVGTISMLVYGGIWMSQEMFDDGKLTPFGATVIAGAVTFVVSFGVLNTVVLLANVIFIAVVAFFAVVAFEYLYEFIELVVDKIAEKVTELYSWLTEKYNEFKSFLASGVKYIKNWWKSNFNSGYRYATENPQIALDTYKLRNYAQRLQAVNRRISNLDRRLDSLYWKVGLFDLWNLIRADLLTGYNYRITRCVSYLNDTASDFENAESAIQKNL